jgi:hypothetical protein
MRMTITMRRVGIENESYFQVNESVTEVVQTLYENCHRIDFSVTVATKKDMHYK